MPYRILPGQKFRRFDFKALPKHWLWFSREGKENLFVALKIGELKDGRMYVTYLAGKYEGKLTGTEEDILANWVRDIAERIVKDKRLFGKKIILFAHPPEDWMLKDLPKSWREGLKKKQKEAEEVSYIA